MSRDVLAVDLRTLTVQAEAVAVQIAVTSGVHDALRCSAMPAHALKAALEEAAAKAREAAIARALAEDDVAQAHREGAALVQEVKAWQTQLIGDLHALMDAEPRWRPDVEVAVRALAFRVRWREGTAAWLATVAPDLAIRANVFDRVNDRGCRDDDALGAAAGRIAGDLRRATLLAERLAGAGATLQATEAARAERVRDAEALRLLLQQRLRQVQRGWTLAQSRQTQLPSLDLTLVRAAAHPHKRAAPPVVAADR